MTHIYIFSALKINSSLLQTKPLFSRVLFIFLVGWRDGNANKVFFCSCISLYRKLRNITNCFLKITKGKSYLVRSLLSCDLYLINGLCFYFLLWNHIEWKCVKQIGVYVLNFCHLDPKLSETSGSEPGRKDELWWGPAPAPDAQHRPEWTICAHTLQGLSLCVWLWLSVYVQLVHMAAVIIKTVIWFRNLFPAVCFESREAPNQCAALMLYARVGSGFW